MRKKIAKTPNSIFGFQCVAKKTEAMFYNSIRKKKGVKGTKGLFFKKMGPCRNIMKGKIVNSPYLDIRLQQVASL
jgi:hypothetical protein